MSTDYVLCVEKDDRHTEDSVETKCVQCDRDLWIHPHHIEKKRSPICLPCVRDMDQGGLEFHVDKIDLDLAAKEIRKKMH